MGLWNLAVPGVSRVFPRATAVAGAWQPDLSLADAKA
uniref:Karyopherin subunit alpha 5 n=1 Tax=Homo sapiens TaxID=9606 RepID=Q5TD90_HUMAN